MSDLLEQVSSRGGLELFEIEGVEVSSEDAGADEGTIVLGEAAEDVIDGVVLAGVGEANHFVDVAVGDGNAVDGLGGIEGGVEEEVVAVGGPDRVGAGRNREGGPGAGGDGVEANLALVDGEGGDVAAIGGPAGTEEAGGVGDFLEGAGGDVDGVEGAGGVVLAHGVVGATEGDGFAIGGPGGVSGVAGLVEERSEIAAVGAGEVDLPGLSGFAGHDGDARAVGRPAGEEGEEGIGGDLEFFGAVGAGAPEVGIGVGPDDPLAVSGVLDTHGIGKKSFYGDELAGGRDQIELIAGVGSHKEDAVAGASGDGRFELKRAIGKAGGIGGGEAGELPKIVVAAFEGLEDEGAAVGGPDAAAFGGGLIEVGQDAAGGAVGGGDLPDGKGVGDGVEDGETEELAVGFPAEPEGAAGGGGLELRGAAGDR